MHGVHGRRWSVCVGWEDRKMTARLMKRSGATLIRDGGKLLGRKARRRKLVQEAGSKDVEKRMISWRQMGVGFLGKTARSLGNSRLVALFFRYD